MHIATEPMTLEDFRKLPDPGNGRRYELRHGEPVLVPPAKLPHVRIQYKLQELLRELSGPGWVCPTELGYGPLPDHEYWIADVAFFPERKWLEEDDLFRGVPDLVIEVESPSNTAEELEYKETTCLSMGAAEFWTVYPKLHTVRVSTPDGVKRYKKGEQIPVSLIPGASVEVSAIFGE